jgi:hypothetical protein
MHPEGLHAGVISSASSGYPLARNMGAIPGHLVPRRHSTTAAVRGEPRMAESPGASEHDKCRHMGNYTAGSVVYDYSILLHMWQCGVETSLMLSNRCCMDGALWRPLAAIETGTACRKRDSCRSITYIFRYVFFMFTSSFGQALHRYQTTQCPIALRETILPASRAHIMSHLTHHSQAAAVGNLTMFLIARRRVYVPATSTADSDEIRPHHIITALSKGA